MGSIDFVHLLGFEFVMIPLAPLMLLRCFLANPEGGVRDYKGQSLLT